MYDIFIDKFEPFKSCFFVKVAYFRIKGNWNINLMYDIRKRITFGTYVGGKAEFYQLNTW